MSIGVTLIPPHASEASASYVAPRPSALRLVAEAERAGINRVALGEADAESVARSAGAFAAVEVLLNHTIGNADPCASAERFAVLYGQLDGRLSLRVSPGKSGRRALAADPEDDVAACRRADEYLTLLKRLWCNGTPFDHEGPFYSISKGYVENKGPQPVAPEIRMDRCTGAALQLAARHANVFELPPGSIDDTRILIERVRSAAQPFGRAAKIRFAMPWTNFGDVAVSEAAILSTCAQLGVSELIVSHARLASGLVRRAYEAPQPAWHPGRGASSASSLGR